MGARRSSASCPSTPRSSRRGTLGHAPLVSRAADLPGGLLDLFSNDAVDELVSRRGLRTPFLRVAKRRHRPCRTSAFTAGGGIGAGIADQVSDDKLLRLFADGSTLVLQGLHRTWQPIIAFCQQLAADLGHPVQANAYVTPPQNNGFSDHYDVHDVFVLQVGRREALADRTHRCTSRPLRDQPWTDRRAAVEEARASEPLLEIDAPTGRLPLPPARLPARGHRPRRRQHPPHARRPRLDPPSPRRRARRPRRSRPRAGTNTCGPRYP